MQTKRVLSPISCAWSRADNKMSKWYFLFIFSCYIKPKLISEKFDTIFVKQFLPWNSKPCKPCIFQEAPETTQKILHSKFSKPIPNSKHHQKGWDSFCCFWLGLDSLPGSCDYTILQNSMISFYNSWFLY